MQILAQLTTPQLQCLCNAYNLAKVNDFKDPYQNDYEGMLYSYLKFEPSNEQLDEIEANLEPMLAERLSPIHLPIRS